MKLKPDDTMLCPHCMIEQDDPAKDFVRAGKTGIESRADHQCIDCDEEFSAELTKDGMIDVQEL